MPPSLFVSLTVLTFLAVGSAASSPPSTQVPYTLVEEACGEKIRQWGAVRPSVLPAASDEQWAFRGSWWAGDGVPGDRSWLAALGTAGSMEFSFLQTSVPTSGNTAASVANVTSVHFYLVNGAVHPIPPPVMFDAAGVLNPLAGELCLACCPRRRRQRPISASECSVRASVTLHYPAFAALDVPVSGRLEVLDGSRPAAVFFAGVVENHKGQGAVRAALDVTTVLLAGAETAAVLAQFRHVVLDPAAATGVSVVGVAFQAAILAFRWVEANREPIIHSTRHSTRHFWASNLWVANMAAQATLALSWVSLVLLLGGRKARALRHRNTSSSVYGMMVSPSVHTYPAIHASPPAHTYPTVHASPLGPLWMMGLSFPPYLFAWYLASTSNPPHPFSSFAEIFLPLWLLPQALSNFAYDLGPSRSLSLFFLFGVSTCRLIALAHTLYRPRSPYYIDIFQHLPRESLWFLSLFLLLLSTLALLQQAHGGRFSFLSHDQPTCKETIN